MKNAIKYAPRAIASFILLQTLYFKFGIGGEAALNESKAIFGTITEAIFGVIGYESYLRIGTGILELIAALLILFNRTTVFGALMALGLMAGAILSHILFIGIIVKDDGAQLFMMSIVVLLCSAKVLYDEKDHLKSIL